MLSNNPNKSFLEQLDETKNEKLQEFYKKYNYTNGFSSLLEVLINSVSKILDPTIYVNFIDEFGNKHYFYDEWKDSLILGRKNHIQDSNQRQFYIFALNLYNKLLMPFNYLVNSYDSEIEFNTDSVNSDLSSWNIRKFKKEFYKEFYQPIFGEIKKMQEATDEAKTRSAKIMIKNFLENSIIKKPDNNNQLTENKNLINTYELRAKDITGIEFNEYWLNPNKDENE
ncbi:Uncharacterised protein (plasmid) [Mycoplasmopsis maculosa]|uniref:Uncharacterized protein n=1 Tax=Mycoplasmopsis maculosa TaxID=114885 RepID=A0A449B5G5_9BACT|nr:hypothetical protein [Mycoplasmopsis maculosa]VEU75304.1 Uncharacterised protein [Mycoplasmopsis maculosa]VEU75840.1 Uncharacterised protein [Mycoplasmopsis maculosa]